MAGLYEELLKQAQDKAQGQAQTQTGESLYENLLRQARDKAAQREAEALTAALAASKVAGSALAGGMLGAGPGARMASLFPEYQGLYRQTRDRKTRLEDMRKAHDDLYELEGEYGLLANDAMPEEDRVRYQARYDEIMARYGDGTTSESLWEQMEQLQAQLDADQDRMTDQRSYVQIAQMTEEEKKALENYAASLQGGIDAVPAFITRMDKDVKALFEKYGRENVDTMAQTLKRGWNQETAQMYQKLGQQAGEALGFGGIPLGVGSGIIGSAENAASVLRETGLGTGGYSTADPYSRGSWLSYFAQGVGAGGAKTAPRQMVDLLEMAAAANPYATEMGGAPTSFSPKIYEATRGTKAGEVIDAVGSGAYQAVNTAVDSLARAYMGGAVFGAGSTGAKALSLGLAGARSFGDTYNDVSAKGGTPAQAAVLGVFNAGTEIATEYIPLEEWWKVAESGSGSTVAMLKAALKQGGMEATQEEIGFLATTMMEYAVLREKSEYQVLKRELMAMGYSPAAAERMMWEEFGKQAAGVAATSFFSGALSEAGAEAYRSLMPGTFQTEYDALSDQIGNSMERLQESGIDSDISEVLQNAGVSKQQAKKIAGAYALDVYGIELTEEQRERLDSAMKDEKLAAAIREAVGKDAFAQRNGIMKNAAQDTARTDTDGTGQDGGNTEGDKTAEEKAVYTVSEDGRDHLISAPEKSVNVAGIASTDGGKVTVRLEDGGTADLEDVSFGDEGKAVVYSFFSDMSKRSDGVLSNMSADTMNEMIGLYDPSVNPDAFDFAAGAADAYFYGYEGIVQKSVPKGLTEAQYKIARNLGARDGIKAATTEQARLHERKIGKGKYYEKFSETKNGVHYDDVNIFDKKLNSRQKTGIQVLEFLAALGMDVHVFESRVGTDGKRIGDNGRYIGKDGSIHIDLSSGAAGEGLMVYAISHEFTHFIEDWSPVKFREFANALFEELGRSKQDVEGMIQNTLDRVRNMPEYEGMSEQKLRKIAYSEVVAECCETMLTDTDLASRIAQKIESRDKSLRDKIQEFFENLLTKLKNVLKINKAYQNLSPDSVIAVQARDTIRNVEALREAFANAAVDAIESYRVASEESVDTGKNDILESHQVTRDVDTDLDVLFMARNAYDPETASIKQQINSKSEELSEMAPVANLTVPEDMKNKGNAAKWAIGLLKPTGYQVDRMNFGKILFSENDINNAMNYADTPAEKAAIAALPMVLKRGIEIGGHPNHKKRSKATVTFAGPVVLNGVRGNMGVVVNLNGNHYYTHRIILPDGSAFVFPKKKTDATQEPHQGVTISGSLADTTSVASNDKIPQNRDSVKGYEDKIVLKSSRDRDDTRTDNKYSDRTGESVSNRSLLAKALESVAKDETELRKLKEYQGNIEQLDKQEARLAELNAEIKELSFGKGPRDKAKLSALRDEKIKTQNRINILDKVLLRMEAAKPLQRIVEVERGKVAQRERQKARESLDAKSENRKKTAIKYKIRNFKKRMESRLLHPTDNKYVPEQLARAMIEVCQLIDTDTALYKKDGSVNEAQRRRNLTKEKLGDLKDAYDKLKDDGALGFLGEFDQQISAYLGELKEKYSGKKLSDMTLGDLNEFYSILSSIEATLRDAKKLIGWADSRTIHEAGDAILAEQRAITNSRKNGSRNAAQKARDRQLFKTLSPMRNVERMSAYHQDSYLLGIFKKLEEGVRQKNKFTMDVYKSFEKLTSGKEYDKALYDEFGGKKYTDVNGRKFGVSKMQMMQCILSLEREAANGMDHIKNGGFTFADLGLLRKGNVKEAISEEHDHRVANAVVMASEFREALKGDEWCQKYMEASRKFFNETAKNAINETMLSLKHRIVARDKSYIPFEVDKNFVNREVSAKHDIQQTINSYGMLKETKKGAAQPLIITGLNNVIDRHIDRVGNVYGLAVPVRNFNKVWNASSGAGKNTGPTIKAAIQLNWGNEGVEHIEQAVQDIQGPRPNNQSRIYQKMKSRYIGSTFAANLSVVSKQIGSMYSASSMLRWRDPVRMTANLLHTMVKHKEIAAEVDKYTATAWMRRQGMSDAELHTLLTQAKKPGVLRLADKIPAALNPAKWITAMDHAVALSLWKYAKQDTARRTGLKDEALLVETAKFYDDLIESTQSMSDMLHRPEVQKSGNWESELFGTFKTDLYQMAGQLQNAAGRFSANKSKENAKALTRTAYGITRSILWTQLITILFAMIRYKMDPYRDEKDKDITLESFMKRVGFQLAGEFMGYLFPMFGGEAVDIAEAIAYGERQDTFDIIALSAANDLADVLLTLAGNIKDEEMPTPQEMKKATVKALQLFGMPANNAVRIYDAIRLHAEDIANGQFLSFEAGANRSATNHVYRIVDEIDQGNAEKAQEYFDQAVEEIARKKAKDGEYGSDEVKEAKSQLKSTLGTLYKDGLVTGSIAEDMLRSYWDLSDDDIHWTFDKWDYAMENDGSDGYQKNGKLYAAALAGEDISGAMAELVEHGKEEKDVLSELKNQIGVWYTDEESDIRITRDQAGKMLGKYCDLDKDEIETQLQNWDFETENGYGLDDIRQTYLDEEITAAEARSVLMGRKGDTQEEADRKIAEWDFEKEYEFPYSERRQGYAKGLISSSELLREMMAISGYTREQAEEQLRAYDWLKKNPSYDLSVDEAIAYTRTVEALGKSIADTGIRPDVFLDYRGKAAKCKGTDSDGDGKADSGSKKKQILEVIDKMPISKEQKDALYFLNGWAKSTLDDAPWH